MSFVKCARAHAKCMTVYSKLPVNMADLRQIATYLFVPYAQVPSGGEIILFNRNPRFYAKISPNLSLTVAHLWRTH